jgi:hypothetical protein
MRKIIQVVNASVMGNVRRAMVLCDDGTIWEYTDYSDKDGERVHLWNKAFPDIPQDEGKKE